MIRAALICPDLTSRLRGPGVVLEGAQAGTLDLRDQVIGAAFVCRGCTIGRVDASGSTWARGLSLPGATLSAGLDLTGATLSGGVDLEAASVSSGASAAVLLDGARLGGDFNIDRARLGGALSARGARVGGDVRGDQFGAAAIDLDDAVIGGDVDFDSAGVAGQTWFDGASIGGDLTMRYAQTLGPISAEGTTIGGDLRLDAVNAATAELRAVSTKGAVVLSGATFAGRVVLDKARIGGDLWIRAFDGAPPPTIAADGAPVALSMRNAVVGGRIDIAGARFGGKVDFDALRVAEDLWLRRGSVVEGPVVAVFARVGQNVDFSGAALGDVDGTGIAIGGELRLGSPGSARPEWRDGATLSLRNGSAVAVVDTSHACDAIDDWPPALDLAGFSYARIGGLGGGDERARARCGFYAAWLQRQQPFSLDPYRRLADLLDRGGDAAAARAVRWAGKERQLGEAEGMEWLRLALQRIFVGYGIYTYSVFVWMIGMALLGAVVFRRAPESRMAPEPLGLLFSIDVLLPFVSFRPAHAQIDFVSRYRYYLYFHRFMGWVFALFFVSGLGGLFAV